MVHIIQSGGFEPEIEAQSLKRSSVKLEIDNVADVDEFLPANKKSKFSASIQQQWKTEPSTSSVPPDNYNPLDEPSPLGLRLRKSPSLLDLIQMRLSQGNSATFGIGKSEQIDLMKKDNKCSLSAPLDKMKASNFPVSLLRIGSWERVSKYDGDLVAKCYFAKHRLVWEVLSGGLKSKIEIQWSDITFIKATFPKSGPSTLDVVLARPPLFFKETNPQPRKHTLWQATSDFTEGQASMHRRHFLQCAPDLLSKHFEKLIQCDPRLNLLSHQSDIKLDNPYFEQRMSELDNQEEFRFQGIDNAKSDNVSISSGLQETPSPCTAQSSTSTSELLDHVGISLNSTAHQIPSPDSWAIDKSVNSESDEKKPFQTDQMKTIPLHSSMSMTDLMNHLESRISEQVASGNSFFSGDDLQNRNVLEELAQYLLSDTNLASTSDEQKLMSRVNSLCCLLQQDPSTLQNPPVNIKRGSESQSERNVQSTSSQPAPNPTSFDEKALTCDAETNSRLPSMSRKESFGDLLLNLPRIASLPQFLFNIMEDSDEQSG